MFEYAILGPSIGFVVNQTVKHNSADPAKEYKPGSTRNVGTASRKAILSMIKSQLCSITSLVPARLRYSSLLGSFVFRGRKIYGRYGSNLKRTPASSKNSRIGLCRAALVVEAAIGSCWDGMYLMPSTDSRLDKGLGDGASPMIPGSWVPYISHMSS